MCCIDTNVWITGKFYLSTISIHVDKDQFLFDSMELILIHDEKKNCQNSGNSFQKILTQSIHISTFSFIIM